MTDAARLFSSTTNLAVTKKCVAAFAPLPPSQLVWLTNAVRLSTQQMVSVYFRCAAVDLMFIQQNKFY